MRFSKKALLALLLMVFIAIQFIPPARNQSGQALPTDIARTFILPNKVQSIFQTACYDCHSNNTNYLWYFHIQPIGWLLSNHIKEGKAELNFSEFGTYSTRRQLSKLRAIENSIKDNKMPLSSYTLIHHNARLNEKDKALIVDWIRTAKDSLALKRK